MYFHHIQIWGFKHVHLWYHSASSCGNSKKICRHLDKKQPKLIYHWNWSRSVFGAKRSINVEKKVQNACWGKNITSSVVWGKKKTKLRNLFTCFILQLFHFWILTVHYTNLFISLPEGLTKLQASEKRQKDGFSSSHLPGEWINPSVAQMTSEIPCSYCRALVGVGKLGMWHCVMRGISVREKPELGFPEVSARSIRTGQSLTSPWASTLSSAHLGRY